MADFVVLAKSLMDQWIDFNETQRVIFGCTYTTFGVVPIQRSSDHGMYGKLGAAAHQGQDAPGP